MQVIEKTKHVKANEVFRKANQIIVEALSNRRDIFHLKLKIHLQYFWHDISLEQKFQNVVFSARCYRYSQLLLGQFFL